MHFVVFCLTYSFVCGDAAPSRREVFSDYILHVCSMKDGYYLGRACDEDWQLLPPPERLWAPVTLFAGLSCIPPCQAVIGHVYPLEHHPSHPWLFASTNLRSRKSNNFSQEINLFLLFFFYCDCSPSSERESLNCVYECQDGWCRNRRSNWILAHRLSMLA